MQEGSQSGVPEHVPQFTTACGWLAKLPISIETDPLFAVPSLNFINKMNSILYSLFDVFITIKYLVTSLILTLSLTSVF